MLGIVFDEKFHVAVFNLDKLAKGDIAFGSNSFRADKYEPYLREAVAKHEHAIVADNLDGDGGSHDPEQTKNGPFAASRPSPPTPTTTPTPTSSIFSQTRCTGATSTDIPSGMPSRHGPDAFQCRDHRQLHNRRLQPPSNQ